jgi:transposase
VATRRRSWLETDYVSVPDAARRLGVSEQTVRNWCNNYLREGAGASGQTLKCKKYKKYRLIAVSGIDELKRRNLPQESAPVTSSQRLSASGLDFLPQVLQQLESAVGEGLAERLRELYGASHHDVHQRAVALARRAEVLLEHFEARYPASRQVTALRRRFKAVTSRLSDLGFEDPGA